MYELSRSLHIKMKHASLKHPQTVGVVERAHDSFEMVIKIHTNETWSNWHRYSNLATFIHNTSYHSSIGTTPSTIFHGKERTKPIDLRFTLNKKQPIDIKSDYVIVIQDSLMSSYATTENKIIEYYHKYRSYYDKKKPIQVTQIASVWPSSESFIVKTESFLGEIAETLAFTLQD